MKEEDNHTVWLSNRDFHSKPFCFCYHLFITQANWGQAVSLIWWLEETGSPSYSYVDHALHNLRGPGSFSMLDIVVFSVFSSTPCLQNSASVFSLEFAPHFGKPLMTWEYTEEKTTCEPKSPTQLFWSVLALFLPLQCLSFHLLTLQLHHQHHGHGDQIQFQTWHSFTVQMGLMHIR